MRIGMFADMYTPHVSGVTNYIRLYKRELEALGHEVFVLTFGNRDHVDDEPNVIRSAGVPWGSTGWQVPMPLSREARQVIASLDVMHVHHPFVSGRIALSSARKRNVPVVFTNHTRYDVYADVYAGFVPKFAAQSQMRAHLHRFARQIDCVLAPSPEIALWLKNWGVTDKAEVFRNVIDVTQFHVPPRKGVRAQLGLTDDHHLVAYLGRVAPEKNIDVLFGAFRKAAWRDVQLAMVVIGDGPSRPDFERGLASAGLAPRVCFLGTTPYEEVPGYLVACDFFATASTSETWPLVVMEAGAAGLPTVGVAAPGVGELVEHDRSGLLVHDDIDEFADAMYRMATDDDLRGRLSAGAREVSGEYDIKPAARRMAELYENLIEDRERVAGRRSR